MWRNRLFRNKVIIVFSGIASLVEETISEKRFLKQMLCNIDMDCVVQNTQQSLDGKRKDHSMDAYLLKM